MSRLIRKIASLIHGIASLIMKIMIQAWQITQTQNIKLSLEATSLDEFTRQLPEGYYSTFRTFNGCTQVLGLSAHLRRLYEPVLAPGVSESFLRRQLLTLLEPYRPEEARVRVLMTKQGQAYIGIEPLKALPREVYEEGVRAETTEIKRETPRLKSTAFITASEFERKHLAQTGIFEALLVKNGEILEGMTSNFFYVRYLRASSSLDAENAPHSGQREDILYTAQDDILLGITRQTVIDVARGRGVEIKYEPLKRDQLAAIDEAFITSSSRGIVPVVRIDDVTIGQGRPGPTTKELSVAYGQYMVEKAEKI
jgi:branched-chain amino acid aminotransferase